MRVVVVRGPQLTGPFTLHGGANYFGRDEACDVHLPSRRVSRRHAVGFLAGQRLTIKDLGSANGLVDESGHRCEALELGSGQRLQVGDYVLRFEADELPDDLELDVDDPLTASDDLLLEDDEEDTPVPSGPMPVPREVRGSRPRTVPPLPPLPATPDPGRLTMESLPSPLRDVPTAETSMRTRAPALPFGPAAGGFGAFAGVENSAEQSRSDIRPILAPAAPPAVAAPAPPPPYVPTAAPARGAAPAPASAAPPSVPAVPPLGTPSPPLVPSAHAPTPLAPTPPPAPAPLPTAAHRAASTSPRPDHAPRRGLAWVVQAVLVLLAAGSVVLCAPLGGLVASWRGAANEAESLSLMRGDALADALANRNANALANNRGTAFDTSFVTQQPGVREAMLADKNGTVQAPAERLRTSIARSEAFLAAEANHALTRVESDGGTWEILAPVRAEVAAGSGARTIVGWAWIRYDPSVAVDQVASPWIRVLAGLSALGTALGILLAGGWWLFVRPLQALRDETEYAMKGDVERVESPVPFFALDQLADSINRLVKRNRS